MAFRMFTEPGDYMLTEEYVYPSALEAAVPMGVRPVGVRMDAEGILPSHMDEILSSWDPSTRNGAARPRVLYTIPSGQNPTGATQSLQRRRELYAVAQKHDVFILEDDPYYFLQMDPYKSSNGEATATATLASKDVSPHDAFLAALVPSFLSIDTDGRVLRMDSFSKVLFPGSRCGWVTGSAQIVERVVRHIECSTQMAAGLSQLTLYKLLDETWGHEGFLSWLMHLREQYTSRRNAMLAACEKHLPKEVASWVPPAAGMFVSHNGWDDTRETDADPRYCSSGSALLRRSTLPLSTRMAPRPTDIPSPRPFWPSKIRSSTPRLHAACSSCPAPSSGPRAKGARSSSSGPTSRRLRTRTWHRPFSASETLCGKFSNSGRLRALERSHRVSRAMAQVLEPLIDIEHGSIIHAPPD